MKRTERDMSMRVVVIGSAVIVAMMWALLKFKPIPGAMTSGFSDFLAAIFVVMFGFLFVTVASRISGLIGNSSNPISGMTIATLMATCAVFLVIHWTSTAHEVLALTIGGVVCIASAIAGATSQDLKTGYLVGATPYWQQVALVIGVMVSVVRDRRNADSDEHRAGAISSRCKFALDIDHLQPGVDVQERNYAYNGKTYTLVNALGSHEIPDGKYLYDPATNEIEVQWVQGIGSDQAAAPQARLMATVISGILNQRLPWRLVFLGVFLVIAIELLGVRSLPFAVGSYLSIATTMAMFAGGLVRWLAEQGKEKEQRSRERSQSGIAVCEWIDRGGRRVWIAGDRFELDAGPDFEHEGAALAGGGFELPWPEGMFAWGTRCRDSARRIRWAWCCLCCWRFRCLCRRGRS